MNFAVVLRACCSLLRLVVAAVFALLYWPQRRTRVPPVSSPLLLMPAVELAQRIKTKQVRSEDVVAAYIDRIREVQPIINAMADDRFTEALAEARQADHKVDEGTVPEDTPFFGVPFTIKISVAVKGMPQSTGLMCRKNVIPNHDAEVVRMMKKAGAILICTSNTPELCMWWESSNSIYGKTCNPYDVTRTPGGSSGGEGALISSACSPMGIGSDIGGSIRIPSMFCGIFGHKASMGITPVTGKAPPADGELAKFLVTGPMCRYVEDLEPMFKILSGSNASRLKLGQPVDLSKLRVYYLDEIENNTFLTPISGEQRRAVAKIAKHFHQTYGVKAQKISLPEIAWGFELWIRRLKQLATTPFEAEMADRKGMVNAWQELALWTLGKSEHTLPAINMGLMDRLLGPTQPWVEEYLITLLNRLLEPLANGGGILILPTLPETALRHYETIPKSYDIGFTGIWNLLGLPATTCPMGLSSQGLPLGVTVIAAMDNDHVNMAVAAEIGKTFGGWKQARAEN